jgi:hypothetical protein
MTWRRLGETSAVQALLTTIRQRLIIRGMQMAAFTTNEKLACVARELVLRRNAYPKWVAGGRMKQETADREIALMEAIVADYRAMVREESEPSLL